MEKITTVAGLKTAIKLLEEEQAVKGKSLRDQLNLTYESFKPAKLIHSTLKDLVTAPYMLDNILDTGLSLATGYFSKRLVVGASSSIIRKILGAVIQIGASKFMSNRSGAIRNLGANAVTRMFSKKKKPNSIEKPARKSP